MKRKSSIRKIVLWHRDVTTEKTILLHTPFAGKILPPEREAAEYEKMAPNMVYLPSQTERNMRETAEQEIRLQMKGYMEDVRQELSEERQGSMDRERMEERLEQTVQQQGEQIRELEALCRETSNGDSTGQESRGRGEMYRELFDNESKLERMRYGILY